MSGELKLRQVLDYADGAADRLHRRGEFYMAAVFRAFAQGVRKYYEWLEAMLDTERGMGQ
jgi:hypothetical protein